MTQVQGILSYLLRCKEKMITDILINRGYCTQNIISQEIARTGIFLQSKGKLFRCSFSTVSDSYDTKMLKRIYPHLYIGQSIANIGYISSQTVQKKCDIFDNLPKRGGPYNSWLRIKLQEKKKMQFWEIFSTRYNQFVIIN